MRKWVASWVPWWGIQEKGDDSWVHRHSRPEMPTHGESLHVHPWCCHVWFSLLAWMQRKALLRRISSAHCGGLDLIASLHSTWSLNSGLSKRNPHKEVRRYRTAKPPLYTVAFSTRLHLWNVPWDANSNAISPCKGEGSSPRVGSRLCEETEKPRLFALRLNT